MPATRSSASSAPRSTSSSPATSTSRTHGGSRISSSSTREPSRPRGCAATAGPVTTSSRSRARTWTSGGATRSTGRSGSSSSRPRRRRTRSTRRGSRTRCARRERARSSLIDGEHYAPVVRDALAALPYDVVGALLVGGTEKLRGGDDYGVPLVDALDAVEADLVVDLSDEPVLGPRERMLWASRALALGLPYVGADFRFDPPPLEPVETPSLAVIGLGKRIGKTAVAGHVARVLAATAGSSSWRWAAAGRPSRSSSRRRRRSTTCSRSPVRAGMRPPTISRRPRSRASRRSAAGGPGEGSRAPRSSPTSSRAPSSPRSSSPELLVFDGSGAALPPVEADARILVTNGGHDARAGLNAYRVLVSDLVVDTGGADREAIRSISDVPVVAAELRLRPAEPLARPPHRRLHDRPGADRRARRRDRPRLPQPRAAGRAARGARAGRRGGVPRRAQGGRGRRRGRGRARARRRGRPRRERRRLARARRARADLAKQAVRA